MQYYVLRAIRNTLLLSFSLSIIGGASIFCFLGVRPDAIGLFGILAILIASYFTLLLRKNSAEDRPNRHWIGLLLSYCFSLAVCWLFFILYLWGGIHLSAYMQKSRSVVKCNNLPHLTMSRGKSHRSIVISNKEVGLKGKLIRQRISFPEIYTFYSSEESSESSAKYTLIPGILVIDPHGTHRASSINIIDNAISFLTEPFLRYDSSLEIYPAYLYSVEDKSFVFYSELSGIERVMHSRQTHLPTEIVAIQSSGKVFLYYKDGFDGSSVLRLLVNGAISGFRRVDNKDINLSKPIPLTLEPFPSDLLEAKLVNSRECSVLIKDWPNENGKTIPVYVIN